MPAKLIEDRRIRARATALRTPLPEFELMLRSTELVRLAIRRSGRVPAPDDLVMRIRTSLNCGAMDHRC